MRQENVHKWAPENLCPLAYYHGRPLTLQAQTDWLEGSGGQCFAILSGRQKNNIIHNGVISNSEAKLVALLLVE